MTSASHSGRALVRSDIECKARNVFGSAWKTDPQVQDAVRVHASRYLDRLRSLSRAEPGKVRARTYLALRSFDARFCSVILAWPKGGPEPCLADVVTLAVELDARQDCGEPIRAYFKKKASGYRPICRFGVRRRALQRLARDILEACFGPSLFEFSRRGRGRDAATRHMQNAFEKGGARWTNIADIKSCFASFNREGLNRLIPLPWSVIENCILIPETAEIILDKPPKKKHENETSETAVRRGIPQGSLASSYIVSKLLEPLLAQLKGVAVLSHGDDIVSCTKGEADAKSNQQALAAMLEQHPAGPLLMKKNDCVPLGRPIEALGYRTRRRAKFYGGGVRHVPSRQAFDRFYARTFAYLLTLPLDQIEQAAWDRADTWKQSFPLWDRSAAADDLVEIYLAQWVIAPARTALMKANKLGIYADAGPPP